MSLLRLLTTGNSLVGIKDAEARYQVSRQRLLPKFGPTRNPFRNTAASSPAQAACAGPTAQPTVARPLARITSRTPVLGLALVKSLASRRSAVSALLAKTAGLGRGFAGKLRAVFARRGRKPAVAVLPRPQKLPVQGEFSLDRIKVVRNDLSDTDLEVIPAKPLAAQAGPKASPPHVESAAASETAGGRLSGCFPGGKT
jgi:hypothetical protein